jgi:hypothetical protein
VEVQIERIDTAIRAVSAEGQPFAVAVTGHCRLGDGATTHFVAQAFDRLLAQLQRDHPAGLVALSGLAEGADTLFAEAALARGIALEVCLACADVIENFPAGAARNQHLLLRARSRRIHTLPFIERSNAAYMALGRWLVDASDLLIAAWNGLPAAAEGGTGDVVAYARQRGRPVIHIHTLHTTVTPLQ